MRSAASSLFACLACCATCHGFTLALSGAPPTPRALLSERRTNIAMGMGARGNAPRNPLAAAGAGAARVAAASTASVVQIFSSHPVVEIFSSQLDCADSAAAKRLLGSAGVEFTEHDCSSAEHAQCAPMSKAGPTKARPQWRQARFTSARACLRPPNLRPASADRSALAGLTGLFLDAGAPSCRSWSSSAAPARRPSAAPTCPSWRRMAPCRPGSASSCDM